ncbi:MAG: 4Fe-4S dicluster domain-containing protein [Phycisphaerales bacterium]|nr:4Fe-4S dicluster domain-containing protein [Phycisphaerales bacterium]
MKSSANRRWFLKSLALAGAPVVCPTVEADETDGHESGATSSGTMGVLMDITQCVGCRKCEYACGQAAGFNVPPIETFDDRAVFENDRRPGPASYTVVNRYAAGESPERFVKVNCLHCNEPACASACLVGALQKTATGAVVYDPWKCMGCRYCMVACPFQIPAYEYDNAFTPQVRKCTMCADRIANGARVPACVEICPKECLIYGRRDELLALAHDRIRQHPDRYVEHIYGEHEAGGASWLYLSDRRFADLGFVAVPAAAPSHLTETLQHAVFKHWAPPACLYGLLGAIMWLSRRPDDEPKTSPAVPTMPPRLKGAVS